MSIGSNRVGYDWSDLACMHALEKEMATHSSVLAWRIPGTEEPGGLPSMGSHSRTRLQRQQQQRLSSSSSSGMWVSWFLHKNSPSTTTWINRHTPSSSAWHGESLLSTLLHNNWVNQLLPPRWGSLNQIENTRWWIFPSLFPSWTLS